MEDSNKFMLIDSLSSGEGTSTTYAVETKKGDLVSVKQSADDPVYHIKSGDRVRVLIFNHEFYDKDPQEKKRRKTADEHSDALKKTFEKLDFKVECFKDLTLTEIEQELENVQIDEEGNKDCDCLMVVVMTHGGTDGMLTARDHKYNLDVLWAPLKPSKCPSLAGKPKIFIIQACRGHSFDSGVCVRHLSAHGQVQHDAISSKDQKVFSQIYMLPNTADFLFAFSTTEGIVSFRAPFITYLCETLDQYIDDEDNYEDFLSLLTEVSRKVATQKNLYKEKDGSICTYAQSANFSSHLIRKIIFPKTKKN